MNYEWEIRKLELELKQTREMNAIYVERIEANDKDLEYQSEVRLERIEADLETLTANVDKLVAVLLREHSKGKS